MNAPATALPARVPVASVWGSSKPLLTGVAASA